MKPCPFCAELIQDAAAKCRFCGEWLDPTKRPSWSGQEGSVVQRLPTAPPHPPASTHPLPEVPPAHAPRIEPVQTYAPPVRQMPQPQAEGTGARAPQAMTGSARGPQGVAPPARDPQPGVPTGAQHAQQQLGPGWSPPSWLANQAVERPRTDAEPSIFDERAPHQTLVEAPAPRDLPPPRQPAAFEAYVDRHPTSIGSPTMAGPAPERPDRASLEEVALRMQRIKASAAAVRRAVAQAQQPERTTEPSPLRPDRGPGHNFDTPSPRDDFDPAAATMNDGPALRSETPPTLPVGSRTPAALAHYEAPPQQHYTPTVRQVEPDPPVEDAYARVEPGVAQAPPVEDAYGRVEPDAEPPAPPPGVTKAQPDEAPSPRGFENFDDELDRDEDSDEGFDDDLDDDLDELGDDDEFGAMAAGPAPKPWLLPVVIGSAVIVAAGVGGYAWMTRNAGMAAEAVESDDTEAPAPAEAGQVRQGGLVADKADPAAGKPVVEASTPTPTPGEDQAPTPTAPTAPATPPVVDQATQEVLDEARSLYERGSRSGLDEAQTLLEGILAKQPNLPAALALLANIQIERGDGEKALQTATHCSEVAAVQADCWLVLAVLREERFRSDEAEPDRFAALAAYERYMALSPEGRYADDSKKAIERLTPPPTSEQP